MKVISGSSRGMVGTLINVDEGDGIVKSHADASLMIVSLDQLTKYVARARWLNRPLESMKLYSS